MDRLDCDHMLIAVMETGSFTAAAQRLGTSHGQASKLISRLERELGVQLLRRSTRALTATEVGQAYYEKVRLLLAEYDALNDAVRHSSQSPSGRLKVSAPVTFGVNRLAQPLIDFALRYPAIDLDISFADRLVNVVDEGFDLALRIGNLEDSSLVARKLCDIRIILVASVPYLEQHGTPRHWRALSQHQCIIDTNFRDPFHWPFHDEGQRMLQSVSGRLKFSNAEVCLQAASAGLGIACLPTFVAADALRAKALVPLLDAFPLPTLGLYALYPPAKYLAHKSRTLIDYLANAFAGEPLWDQGW